MIRSASEKDLDRIRSLLAEANDAPYDLLRVAEEKCFGAGYEGPPQPRIWGDFEGIAVTCGKYLRLLAVDRASRNRGVGSELLRDAESLGAHVIAAEPGNYFTPGVTQSLVPFFKKRGYRETVRTQNLIVDKLVEDSGHPLSGQPRAAVLHFIEQNFGSIWRFEASRAVSLFAAEEDSQIAAFAAIDANNRGLGFFGPTGVAKAFRGRGLGRRLLLASLADLRRLGYHRAVIPWTDAIEFYRKSSGARIEHRFVILRKNG